MNREYMAAIMKHWHSTPNQFAMLKHHNTQSLAASKKMNRALKYGLFIIATLAVGIIIAYAAIFWNTYRLLGEPSQSILETNWDYEGIRHATIYYFGGNDVTNPIINVSIGLGSGGNLDIDKKEVVFSAENKRGTEVKTKWINFHTLEITYSNQLIPLIKFDKRIFKDSTLDVKITYKKK